MSTTAERMGVAGKGYGEEIDYIILNLTSGHDVCNDAPLTRDQMLALAWALVDQASSLRTTLEAKRAMDAIEDLYDAEEVTP